MLREVTPGMRGVTGLAGPVALFGAVLLYLGVAPLTALLGAVIWVAQGATGAAVIRWLIGGVSSRHSLLLVLGPGALLGIGASVSLFLLLQGGPLGTSVVACTLIAGATVWGRQAASAASTASPVRTVDLLALVGCALVANSREFPNLLVVGVATVTFAVTMSSGVARDWKLLAAATASLTLGYDIVTRPVFWWWSSDDTTTLSAIGTMIVERGRVADLAGWATGSHHWLLHAWLALWNQLSAGQVFETYLIAWPVVAASAAIASLWLCCELFQPRQLDLVRLVVVALVAAGLMRLEWPAPQEQQPFLFSMVACCALWLGGRRTARVFRSSRMIVAVILLVAIVPVWLYVLKPSLLVAYGLLIVGTMIVFFDYVRGWRLVVAAGVSLLAIFVGIGFMGLGGTWVSRRSFTSFAVDFFPDDLGWCQDASPAGSFACVMSLQVVLLFSATLAVVVAWLSRRIPERLLTDTAASSLLLMPLVLAYLPLRYLVSSGVGSGAPSFYRLPEMALMLVVLLGVTTILVSQAIRPRELVVLGVVSIVSALMSRSPSGIYDRVDEWLVSLSPLRYLSASDVIAISTACLGGYAVTRSELFKPWKWRVLTVVTIVVSLTPLTRMAVASVTESTQIERLSRPADFGPDDIEQLGKWLRANTEPDALLATNYLCPIDRQDECTRTMPQIECPKNHPSLMAGWALIALSKRDVLYLSQGWDTKTIYYFEHRRSTHLGSEVSREAIDELRAEGVDYYVASLDHTDPRAWRELRSSAEFASQNFVVVSLSNLMQRSST